VTRAARSAGALALILLLAACASPQRPETLLPGERITGRLAVRVEAGESTPSRALSAGFELEGTPEVGRLDLATPLGTVLAQVRWAPGSATLVTPQHSSRYADLETLTTQLFGESLPVPALFDWLRARPWPQAPSTPSPPPGAGFAQLGWSVDLSAFDDALVVARRDRSPAVTVRAKLDRP
jgi:outer membrane lipoprotein LolB